MSEELNKRVGDYEILGTLGTGGMGKVFKVRNVITDRIEAMKILAPDLAGRQDVTDRFLREIKVLATLDHPNIAALRTAIKVNDQFVMIMEYVEGTTLSARLAKGPIPVPDVLDYVDQGLAGLSYAHQKQVIHRDVKPGNMMLTPNGVVKVMDFGIARAGGDQGMTMSGTTLGSLCYMSPEQVKGQNVDVRSDLYSMGVSLYELVTGERPFRADSDFSLMTAQIEQAPKPPVQLRPDVPAELNEIILTAMAKDPRERFQTADAFRNAVSSVRKTLGEAPTMESIPVPKTLTGTATPVPKTEPSTSTRTLEMAHVLFTDIVAYSQLPMDTQEQTLRQLQDIVRGTTEFSRAQGMGQLIILPTGDGMALVFFGDAEAPARCALEMDRVLRKQSGIPLRMGIHTGPVYRVADINANRNVAGGGINMAQRVMDCGDAGHILVSGALSDVLGQVSTWRQSLHDLGEAEVKHGVRVRIYNLYNDEYGNKETPKKLEAARKAAGATTTATLTPPSIPVPAPALPTPAQPIPSVLGAAPPPNRRGLYMAMGALLVVVVLVAAGLYVPYRNKTKANDNVPPVQAAPSGSGTTSTPSVSNTSGGTTPANTSGASENTPATSPAPTNANANANLAPTSPESTPAPPNPQTQKMPSGTKRAVATGNSNPAQQEAQAPPAQPDDSAQLAELEQTVDQLGGRAAAVNDSLDNLRRQQAASGFGLRGDISSAQEMMKTHLNRAQAALQAHDVKNAQKYSDQASADVEKLEKFLGR
jgi:serine/threonine protein kinase